MLSEASGVLVIDPIGIDALDPLSIRTRRTHLNTLGRRPISVLFFFHAAIVELRTVSVSSVRSLATHNRESSAAKALRRGAGRFVRSARRSAANTNSWSKRGRRMYSTSGTIRTKRAI